VTPISFFSKQILLGNIIRSIAAGKHKIVFVIKGPIYCVMIANTSESFQQLEQQLDMVHSEVLSALTARAHDILRERAYLDLSNLLSGTTRFFDTLVKDMNSNPAFTLCSIHSLRIPRWVRNSVGQLLQSSRQGNIFYAMVIVNGLLLHLARPKKHILFPPDIQLLINYVTCIRKDPIISRTESFFTLICLPIFNSSGFLHLYISFLSKNVSILFLSPKAEDLPYMVYARNKISASCNMRHFGAALGPSTLISDNYTLVEELEEAAPQSDYTVTEVGIPDLLHFVFKSHAISQMTQPKFISPYNTKEQQRNLHRLFQEINAAVYMIEPTKPHKVYFRHSETETIVAWITAGFDLYACLTPLVTKMQAIKACNELLKWIKQEEEDLFIQNAPVW